MDRQSQSVRLKRDLGLFSATALVVANMVGTGIFTTSGFIIGELGSPGPLFACWLAGGLFALCGALCYGELGARFPMAGGEYAFLRETFSPGLGFLSGWISLIVGFSAPIAAAAIAFSAYCFRGIGLSAEASRPIFSDNFPLAGITTESLFAVFIVVAVSMLHGRSLRLGSRVQNGLTLFKVALILVFIGAGIAAGRGSGAHFTMPVDPGRLTGESFAVALIFVTFAYSGWNAAAYLGEEIKNPGKTIPAALFAGTALVAGLYLSLNVLYVYALPAAEMTGVVEVGARAAEALFGAGIGRYFSGAIALGLLSVLSAMMLAGPRVYYAMARDGLFFQSVARVDPRQATPKRAILLQAAIAVVMILSASYDRLLLYIGFTLSLFAMLTVIGLMRLRMSSPPAPGAYATFGYPVTPLLFICGNLWIVYYSLRSRPVPALAGLATIAGGLFAYRYFRKKGDAGARAPKGRRIQLPDPN